MASPPSLLPSLTPPAPLEAPPATHSGGSVALGVFICLAANLSMSLGTNILKLAFARRAKLSEERRLLAAANNDVDATPKLPPVYYDKVWLAGFFLYKAGNLSNFAALGFAPQSLLSAVAAVQFVSNVVFSRLILGASTSRRVLCGVAAIITGVVLLVCFGSHASTKYAPRQLAAFFGGGGFVVWCLILAAAGSASYVQYASTAAGTTARVWLARTLRLRWRGARLRGRARLAVRGATAKLARRSKRQGGHRRTRSDSSEDDAGGAAAPLPDSAAEARHIFENYDNSSVAPDGDDGSDASSDGEGGGLAALADASAPRRSVAEVTAASARALSTSRIAPLCFALFSASIGTFSILFSKCTATCVRYAGQAGYNPAKDASVYAYIVVLVLTGVAWDKQMNKALSLFPAATIMPLMQVAWTLLAVMTGGIFFQEFANMHGGHAALFWIGILIMLVGVVYLVPPKVEDDAAESGAPAESAAALTAAGAALPPPLPARPVQTRGALLQAQAATAQPPQRLDSAFEAVSFSLFTVPTLMEAVEVSEAEGHELPAYFRLERRMATAGEALEEAAEAAARAAQALIRPPPLPPKPAPALPPKPPRPPKPSGDVELGQVPVAGGVNDEASRDKAPAPVVEEESGEDPAEPTRKRRTRKADSTDPVATFMTRRFGLAGGLAWLAVLTFGVVSEQLKTRSEVAREASGTQAVDAKGVTTPSGLRFTDLVRGGGETAPQRGYLLAANVRVVLGEDALGPVLFDTEDSGRPLAFFFGARPFQGALCAGVEEGIASMRAGGTRRLVVPSALGFPAGAHFPQGEVPPGAALTYTVKLLRVSVPPS